MRVLVACEESQAVTIELRKLGHEAWSCDILPCSGGHPEWHLQQDVVPLLDEPWDMVLAFPPCTHLACSGAAWFKAKRANGRQQEGIDFFMRFANCGCAKVAIENPVGIMSTVWRKPDCVIQPWQFGEPYSKKTCLWLKGLPPLLPTSIVYEGDWYYPATGSGKRMQPWYAFAGKDRARIRSRTFPGIARAMAEQWGGNVS
jgi:hypothetical protein